MINLRNSFGAGSQRQRTSCGAGNGRKSGQALIIVLGFVMLMTVLILVFFASVLTERTSSKAVASGVSARQLAQSAMQLVEGTITTATVPTYDTTIAWASQPGMIRTYGTPGSAGTAGTPSSAPLAYYKLYSSSNMVINANSTLPVSSYTVDADVKNGGDLVSNWSSCPALYTDLNAPATASDGTIVFPIVDPRAASGSAAVDGFSYSNSTPTASVTLKSNDFGAATSGGGAGSLLPMPVQWIYVLRDGTLTSPTEPTSDPASATNVASFTGSNAPTANNPIVGRIAFWTDDDCSKVNVNTASEGTYWDAPIANSGKSSDVFTNGTNYGQTAALGDATFGLNQPAQHEFQRYPGHPATTCLSEVFENAINAVDRPSLMKTIDPTTPRINDSASSTSLTPYVSSLGGTQPATATVQPNFNRLYATVDDFNFTPTRTQQNLGTSATTQQIIEQSRFFLTTSSKAPDLNPFGLPRIAIWPVYDSTATTINPAAVSSPLDLAIQRCATVANGAASGAQHAMIFTRADAADTSAMTYDWTLPRNQQLIGYLRTLLGRPIPGFGGTFTTKYPQPDTDQILKEIFDYIRCINLADQTMAPTGSIAVYKGSYTPSLPPNATVNNAAVGEVVPTQPAGATSQGFGRISTIGEMAIGLVKIDDRKSTAASDDSPASAVTTLTETNSGLSVTPSNPQTMIEWTLFPLFMCPMTGYVAMGEDIRVHFSNMNLTVGGVALTQTGNAPAGTAESGPYADLFDTGRVATGQSRSSLIGGVMGADLNIHGTGVPVSTSSQTGPMYPTGLIIVPYTAGAQMTINGTFTVTIYSPNTATTPVQTFNFSFNNVAVPCPHVNYNPSGYSWLGTVRSSTTPTITGTNSTFSYSLDPGKQGNQAQVSLFFAGDGFNPTSGSFTGAGKADVVRSLSPADDASGDKALLTGGTSSIEGDLRLIAATVNVPVTAFQLTPRVVSADGANTVIAPTAPLATDYMVSSMRWGPQISYAGCVQDKGGRLSSMVSYYDYAPGIPNGVTSVTMTNDTGTPPGDWDNGPGLMVDGPWLNKPDEGQQVNTGTYVPYINDYQSTSTGGANDITSSLFSPNRQISSPVMFGSLPVGLDHPWRTLLFRPATLPGYQATASGSYTHPGGADSTIPDHLLLDFFRMPVVEPYAISEPLATAGRVSLNTQIAPFTYITRTTGLRAVLKSVMLTALGNGYGSNYKQGYINTTGAQGYTTRYAIDLNDTISQLTTLNDSTPTNNFPEFSRSTYTAQNPNFFISPSQICDVPLIPLSATGTQTYNNGTSSNLGTFWTANAMTGDNSLERPYSLIYPRVTTQSNTFTVHVRAQSLQKAPSNIEAPATWTEGTDQVTGEYRGSFTVEKYFDPTNATITDNSGNVQTDANDASPSATEAVRGALWRLLYDKRFGQ